MRKQSTMHRSSRSPEIETPTTTFPAPVRTETQPKGLHARDRARPTHLDTGAAESHTQPVDMPRHTDTASTSSDQSDASAGPGGSRTRPH